MKELIPRVSDANEDMKFKKGSEEENLKRWHEVIPNTLSQIFRELLVVFPRVGSGLDVDHRLQRLQFSACSLLRLLWQ